jgi:hypothetical protein
MADENKLNEAQFRRWGNRNSLDPRHNSKNAEMKSNVTFFFFFFSWRNEVE